MNLSAPKNVKGRFLMKKFSALVVSVLLFLVSGAARALETGVPEEQGVSSRAILDWIDSVESNVDALHSFVLVRHGKIIAEGWWCPYEKDRPHMLYSLSKSFTSTAVGIAVDEGRFSLDDKVVSFFPDKAPAQPSENMARMRVRDLLCMGSGNHNDTLKPMKEGTEADAVAPAREASQRFENCFTRFREGWRFWAVILPHQSAECRHGGPLVLTHRSEG